MVYSKRPMQLTNSARFKWSSVTQILGIVFVFLAFIGCDATSSLSTTEEEKNPENYFDENHLRYDNSVYYSQIRSVVLHQSSDELAFPAYQLGSEGQGVVLSFDDLDADIKDCYYKIVHCSAKWEPTGLMENEYMEGFFNNQIRDYKSSYNFNVPFTQYRLTVPNEDLTITRSGNYLLYVFQNNDESQLLLSRRFMVYEPKVQVVGNIRMPSNLDERAKGQEVDFKILHGGFPIPDPFSNLDVVVLQNRRWDNALVDLRPIYVRPSELDYNYNSDENLFKAGNEFRHFDLKGLGYRTEEINSIVRTDSGYHAYLADDVPRPYTAYSTIPDINGQFIIRNYDGFNHQLEAEYVWVHFRVPYTEPLAKGNLYIFGGLSDWQYKPEFRLNYNYDKKRYERKVLLKQGYYNYLYSYYADGAPSGDFSRIEGSHFGTENDYQVLVYYRDITNDYDRLVGFKVLNSQRNP